MRRVLELAVIKGDVDFIKYLVTEHSVDVIGERFSLFHPHSASVQGTFPCPGCVEHVDLPACLTIKQSYGSLIAASGIDSRLSGVLRYVGSGASNLSRGIFSWIP